MRRMAPFTPNEEAIDQILHRLDGFVWTDNDRNESELLRQEFRETYNRQRIDTLTEEGYFAGHGKKKGCLAYDLEWGAGKLGSIRGGSKLKYGYESDFPKIKTLLKKIMSLDANKVYDVDGSLSEEVNKISLLSKDINGFKTGRTVLPKLLSIYYPGIFLPIFNDQDHFLSKLLNRGLETENTGLDLYLEYNFKLLKVKEKLEDTANRTFESLEFARLLYHSFPKAEAVLGEKSTTLGTQEEQKFEALEVQHYQTLLHRNFNRLFPNLKYFDEEEQNPKNGQYDTQIVGIMDMLCTDEKENFVVIEIKRRATDQTIGQVLRYMGWTKEELCKERKTVRGIIVAERKDAQLEFALKVIPNVKFLKLGLSITLEEEKTCGPH